jgi:hypothetical protein
MISFPVPLVAFLPAIVVEAIVLSVVLKPGPLRAAKTALSAGVRSVFIVAVIAIAVELPMRMATDERLGLIWPIGRDVLQVSALALPPGFLLAWWIKHTTVRRRLKLYVPRSQILRATGISHVLSTLALAITATVVMTNAPISGKYAVRSRVGEVLGTMSGARLIVAHYVAETGRLPAKGADVPDGVHQTPQGVVRVGAGGRVTLRVSTRGMPELDGKQFIATPSIPAAGSLVWECRAPEVDNTYLPSECRR